MPGLIWSNTELILKIQKSFYIKRNRSKAKQRTDQGYAVLCQSPGYIHHRLLVSPSKGFQDSTWSKNRLRIKKTKVKKQDLDSLLHPLMIKVYEKKKTFLNYFVQNVKKRTRNQNAERLTLRLVFLVPREHLFDDIFFCKYALAIICS